MDNGDRYRTRMPINRKESFYTGTIFPMLVSEGRFSVLQELLQDRVPLLREPWQEAWDLQFFTEYSFNESVIPGGPNERFQTLQGHGSKDTPDIVLHIYPVGEHTGSYSDTLLAIEAKMFTQPRLADLRRQLDGQREILEHIRSGLNAPELHHLVLVPEETYKLYEKEAKDSAVAIDLRTFLFWDSILNYWEERIDSRETPSQLFAEALGFALHHFDDLVSQGTDWGTNAQARLTGGEIVRRFLEEPENFPYRVMGRNGGFTGADLKRDIASPTTWQAQIYEVSTKDMPPNRNWFPIEEFVKATQDPDYILDASR